MHSTITWVRCAAPPGTLGSPPISFASWNGSPGFRNIVVHEYVALDMRRVVDALNRLEPLRAFLDVVAAIEAEHDAR